MAVAALRVGDAASGDFVCRVGRPVTYWFNVIEGLLKISSDNDQGITMTYTGLRLTSGLVKAQRSSVSRIVTTFRRCNKSVVAA